MGSRSVVISPSIPDRTFSTMSAFGGASYLREKDLFRAMLSLSTLTLENDRFRDSAGLGAEWHRQVDEFNTLSLFGQYARLSYPTSPVRDADFYGAGVGWRHAMVSRMQPVFQVQALYGQEKNDASPVRNDLSRHIYTVRGGVSCRSWYFASPTMPTISTGRV